MPLGSRSKTEAGRDEVTRPRPCLGITNLSQVRASNLQELVYKQGQAGVTKATVSITFNNSGTLDIDPLAAAATTLTVTSPFNNTGNLIRSIKVDESQLKTDKPKARVGTNAVYAPPLEYGSRRNAPRPFLRPTLVNSKTELAELFQKKVFASFRRYMR